MWGAAAAAANKDTAQERSGSRFASITKPFAKKGLRRSAAAGGAIYVRCYVCVRLSCAYLAFCATK